MSINSKMVTLMFTLILNDHVHTANIYGGHKAKPHSRPYMVLLTGHWEDGSQHHCGGFLLNEDFVMTAAHCQAKSYTAFLGVHNVQKLKHIQNISVEQAFPQKDYNENDYSNDIMLLKLSSKAQFNKKVQPITLAERDDGSLPTSCSVSGWGNTDKYPDNMSPVLMEVNVNLVDDCPKKNSYCSRSRKGPRGGDSGGPLVCEDGKAFGLVSVGHFSDNSYIYAYTKIPDYSDWINLVYKKQSNSTFN